MRGRRVSGLLAVGLLLLWPGQVVRGDQTVLKVIPLKHRPAADLIEVLTPLVGAEGSLSALDTRLVVRATPQALARIETALLTLDAPLRSLVIMVSQGLALSSALQSGGVGGVVSAGGSSRTVVRGSLGAQSGSSTDDVTQQIRTLEGHPALIRVGRSEPFATAGAGTAVAESGTGFHVLPRVAGDGVTLELWAENTRGEGPVVVGQDLRTTVSGRLGEWIEVGSALQQAEVRARELLGASSGAVSEARSVRVRVNEVR